MAIEMTRTANGDVAPWFAAVMVETAEAAGIRLTETRIRIYALDLEDLPPDAIVAAFRRVRREGSGFFPSVAEIRRQVEGTPDDRALLAWTALERAVGLVGAYQSLDVADTAAAEALVTVFGTWPAFCAHEAGPELLVKRQAFLAAYRAARARERDAGPRRLIGLHEASGSYRAMPALALGQMTADGRVVLCQERIRTPLMSAYADAADDVEVFDDSLGEA